jgi:hypothetical protein
MLTNFLEHTRCPESIVSPLLTQCREHFDTNCGAQGEHVKDASATRISSSGPVEWLATLQRVNGTGTVPITRLWEFDNAISVLRLEKYLDNSVANASLSGPMLLVRNCYYWMRPFFPVAFRKYLQRIVLRGWDSIPFPSWPVDLTTEKLIEGMWQLLLRSQDLKELPFIWFWPEGQSSCCIMTHDVDTEAGREFCKTIIEIEKRYGITSAFGIVPEHRYTVPDEFLQQIRSNGCEICLHGLNHDGHLFSSQAAFLESAEKIRAYAKKWGAVGFRSPIMYRNLSWLPALELSYDMSVPNVAHLDPQRGGCCTVMPYFIGDLVELPVTTTQDYSLFHILQQRSLDLWKKQIAMIQERHGLINFIIHPDYVTEQWSSHLYDALLGHLAELRSNAGVWIALPKEVAGWWRARREMRLIQQNGAWKITGPQAERARVAYAYLKNGRIEYRMDKSMAVAASE